MVSRKSTKLPSKFQPGARVTLTHTNFNGRVEAVKFTKDKVTYDVALEIGGTVLQNVDSIFVEKM